MTETEMEIYRMNNAVTQRKFMFGKHKGEAIRHVILTDCQYIKWCMENVTWLKFNDDEIKLYKEVQHQIIVDASKYKNFRKKVERQKNQNQ